MDACQEPRARLQQRKHLRRFCNAGDVNLIGEKFAIVRPTSLIVALHGNIWISKCSLKRPVLRSPSILRQSRNILGETCRSVTLSLTGKLREKSVDPSDDEVSATKVSLQSSFLSDLPELLHCKMKRVGRTRQSRA
jgi:hypothetical protein